MAAGVHDPRDFGTVGALVPSLLDRQGVRVGAQEEDWPPRPCPRDVDGHRGVVKEQLGAESQPGQPVGDVSGGLVLLAGQLWVAM